MERKNRVIMVDWMVFVHKSIFAWRKMKNLPVGWYCMNMIVSCLRRLGIEPWDKIIITSDRGSSWRKQITPEYKANRKKFRDSFPDIDWKKIYRDFEYLLEDIRNGTDWNVVD